MSERFPKRIKQRKPIADAGLILVFKATIRINRYPLVFQPRLPSRMPYPVESSNQSKHFVVPQVSTRHDRINRIVSFVFKDASRAYSHRALSLGALHCRVAFNQKRKRSLD